MKHIFDTVIRRGGYDLSAMLARIDEYHISGQLTAAERDTLRELARSSATAASGMDIPGEIQQLWAAVRALQAARDNGSSTADPEFRQPTGAHDAYYTGAVVRWGGKVYECVAPEGVACVWSPEVMPGYWQSI